MCLWVGGQGKAVYALACPVMNAEYEFTMARGPWRARARTDSSRAIRWSAEVACPMDGGSPSLAESGIGLTPQTRVRQPPSTGPRGAWVSQVAQASA